MLDKLKRIVRQLKDKSAVATEPTLSKKELAAQKRKAARDRSKFLGELAGFGAVGATIGIVLLFVVDAKIAIAVGAGIPVLALSYAYPRKALWSFLIYMPFAGTITYWIGGGNSLFQLAKDAFYIPALLALVQQLLRKKKPLIVSKKLAVPIYILLTLSILTFLFVNLNQQFSSKPQGTPVLMGILGLKVFIGYIPLLTCGYYLIRNLKDLLFLTRLNVVMVILCCSLGLVQYLMLQLGICKGTDHLSGVDLFKATLEYKCLIGGSLVFSPSQSMIRLPGTFVAPWQWAWFLISAIFFTFASAFSDSSLRWQGISFIGMALVFINSVISGQRIALALVPLFTVILLVLTGQVTNLKRFIPIATGLGILGIIAMAAFPSVVLERVDSFVSRWNASPPTEFIQHQFEFTSKEQRGLLGNGLGRATNSARVFGDTTLVETYYPKILFELGPLGVIAFLFLVTVLVLFTFKTYRSLKEKHLRGYGAAFWVFVLFISYNTYYYPLDVDPVAVYYWLVAGVIVKLPEIQRQEDEKLKQAELKAAENESKNKELPRIRSSQLSSKRGNDNNGNGHKRVRGSRF